MNSGIVYSDPTTYYGLFDNAGTATFEGDTFETAAVLNNTGVANFAKDGDDNEVTFVSGATITGDGLINLLSGTTHFNNTASSNTIKLANGAMFDGTLASTGVLDTRNGNIDTGLGTVTGGDLYVDANLVAGTADAFADTTGATIRGISLANAGYGTSDSVTVDFGGATLDANAEIDGMNYYTQITQSGSSVTFSDKLINESNLYSKLGSWTGGYYIKSNVDMTNAADADHLTVGQALQALDTAVNGKQATIVDSATIAANGTGGFDVVAGSIGATQLAANSVASSNIIDGTIVNADIATGTITTDRLANQGVQQFTNDANYQNATQVSDAITTALANGTNAYQTADDVTTTLGAYSTTAQMNAAIATATTMGDDGDAGTSMYNNFADGVSVTSAVASLDAAIGTTTTGTHVSATNTVGQNLNALDTALATVESNITATNTAIATATTMNDDSDPSTSLYSHFADGASVKDAVTSIDTALATAEGNITANATAIATLNGAED
ncbi:MAG: hypothetical protein IKZ64_00815, partial [Alphaproteobacteria bacterium]|nr:hypothetical protein [Alphaproteobacteria bacterium]